MGSSFASSLAVCGRRDTLWNTTSRSGTPKNLEQRNGRVPADRFHGQSFVPPGADGQSVTIR